MQEDNKDYSDEWAVFRCLPKLAMGSSSPAARGASCDNASNALILASLLPLMACRSSAPAPGCSIYDPPTELENRRARAEQQGGSQAAGAAAAQRALPQALCLLADDLPVCVLSIPLTPGLRHHWRCRHNEVLFPAEASHHRRSSKAGCSSV